MATINNRFENETLERLRTILTTLATTLNVEIVDPATGLPMTPAYDSTVESLNESVILLRRIAKLLEPMGTQDAQQRQKVAIDSSITVAVGVAQGTLSNVTALGGVDARYQFIDTARIAYATGIRAKLT